MIQLVLHYSDGTPDFIVGSVADDAAATAWEIHARSEPGWNSLATLIRIPLVSAPLPVIPVDQKKEAAKLLLKQFDKTKFKADDLPTLLESFLIEMGLK